MGRINIRVNAAYRTPRPHGIAAISTQQLARLMRADFPDMHLAARRRLCRVRSRRTRRVLIREVSADEIGKGFQVSQDSLIAVTERGAGLDATAERRVSDSDGPDRQVPLGTAGRSRSRAQKLARRTRRLEGFKA
ncbi:hypothetical protein [Streptomyces fagopyri]|uniref:hypothetical protein n=1 Tax=Streptomyces fagopyri TaxID=2662397 RepID=UPI0034019C64